LIFTKCLARLQARWKNATASQELH
jgi:hypothetical protein